MLSAQNVGDFVDVADCRYVAADSVYDQYRCDLDVAKDVKMVDIDGDLTMLMRGLGTYRFRIPRTSHLDDDADEDAELRGSSRGQFC